jgi:hypothetical protein
MKVWTLNIRSSEFAKGSDPSVCGRTHVTRSSASETQTLGVRGGSLLTSRVAKSREDQDRPSEEDRWQRSRDLTNSEVHKVISQGLDAPSREWQSHEEQRQSLDQEPHRLLRVWGFKG